MTLSQLFLGKYRGTISDNKDPLNLGRIRAYVPNVFGDRQTGWAMPCIPYAGDKSGFFFIPSVGANVWIEFENGDLDYPIWVGCFWGDGQTPGDSQKPEIKVLKTGSTTITIDDSASSVKIENSGLKIVMDSSGIEINNNDSNTIKLTQTSVSVNDGALEVM